MPKALLIGQAPEEELGFEYSKEAPYDAVLLGSLSVHSLLSPEDEILSALLEGIPVYVWRNGMEHRRLGGTFSPALYEKCISAEREWRSWGVTFLHAAPKPPLITGVKAAKLKESGKYPAAARLTPLARDILGGKA